jgi:uncharacterized BrkB/YihY/UPF0761 family membrane protein
LTDTNDGIPQLLWVYYSAQLFSWGAEFTKVYAQTVGSRRLL